ncbi:DUF4377 domain-containing protein [Photobacterium sp. OFAV2-7]|uniref:DUF4377 domain-containing protein n=1 Tax=Photobacterium sp. OFAV2-7 TaxID=2917748 RepID=UPI001EF53B36|nr:DUF4377 domain-containing protein [Photobacterium sp. OFAV2-7]MCG7587370.1 DUF4377 domain-containing protein [Photobacterium sp. OFAV2-7]
MYRGIISAAIILTTLYGCSSESSQGTEKLLTIDSHQSTCQGMFQQLCMRTKSVGNNEFELFYGDIEGFTYSWGTLYEVKVKITNIDNPPADASSQKEQLIEILSSTEDQVGASYEFNGVEMLSSTFTKTDGNYYFLGKSFECASGTDCDALVALNNSGGLVNVTFKYLGNATIQLVSWS